MSESGQPAEQNLVRIVYYAGDRTFARLFNERSLDEVKDVVRRKLGLGSETDVSLKQMMGSGALLDFEDDGDFQAFRVLLRSSVSVDIQVTVGRSQGSVVPPLVTPQPREKASVSEPITTSLTSPSKESAGLTPSDQLIAPLKVSCTAKASATPAKTPEHLTRKRKVSFDNTPPGSDKTAEQHASTKSIAVSPVAPAKVTEPPASPKPVIVEEPPKKKQKKAPTKAKDVETTEAVESSTTKASSAPKTKPKKSTASKAAKNGETSELPAKKQKRQKKDEGAPKKSSVSVDRDGTKQTINQTSNLVNEASVQAAAEKGLGVEDGTSTICKSEKMVVHGETTYVGGCAAIPQTSASISVQSEVAAAILSGCLSRASETILPEPPANRKSVKRVTKSVFTSSSGILTAKPATTLTASADDTPSAPTEHRLEQVVLANGSPQQTPDLNGPPCPICLEEPFHIRYYCPTVLKGADAIRGRLEELKRTNLNDQQSLIKQLEGLLCDSEAMLEPSFGVMPIDSVQSQTTSPPPSASLLRTPNIPVKPFLPEVTMEGRSESSSSESPNYMSEATIEHEPSVPLRQKIPDEKPSPPSDDLEAVIRGPVSKRQSILHFLDRIVEDVDDESSDSEGEAELDEDLDEEVGGSRRWSSRRITRSSDEEEESRSSSPSRPAEDTPNNHPPCVQGSDKPREVSTEHPDGDVIMRDPSVLEGNGTNTGPQDHMVVDELIGEKGAVAVAEEQPSSLTAKPSVLQPLNAPRDGLQESENVVIGPVPNQDSSVSLTSEDPKEVEADPIEPADDLEPSTVSRLWTADPIEASSEDIGCSFASVTQSTPKPGVSKRIKNRNGQILDDEADHPVLLEELAPEVTDIMTPVPPKGMSRRKITDTPTTQERVPVRRSPRFSSLPHSTSTPAAVVLLNRKTKGGVRTVQIVKAPAKRSEERSDVSQGNVKDNNAQDKARTALTPSLARWETLAEPSSPSVQLEEPSMPIDELMSSSPQPDDITIRRCLNEERNQLTTPSTLAESSRENGRLFDLSSSQIPFPYSQKRINLAPMTFPDGKEGDRTTDSEEELSIITKRAKLPVRYRSLSQLASQAALFSPSLPTPTNKSVPNGKAMKGDTEEDSSSSSDSDEANGSEHIPRGRRAGSVLEAERKKSRLSRI